VGENRLGSIRGRLCFSVPSCGQVLMKICFVRLHNVYYYILSANIDFLGGFGGRLCFSVLSCGQVLMKIYLVRLHNVYLLFSC
jgi:hypothetical protein